VSAHIGRRISKTESDRDVYRLLEVPAPGGGDQVSIRVSGLPNMDIALALYDGREQLLASRDDGGVGQPEQLFAHRVRSPVYVVVSEARGATSIALPTENVSDEYRLTVTLERAEPQVESEPNDTASDAATVSAGPGVAGWLERRDDVDLYRFSGTSGRYHLTVTGADKLPVRLRRGSDELGSREASVTLAPGDVISVARADRLRPREQDLPATDQRYRLAITPSN